MVYGTAADVKKLVSQITANSNLNPPDDTTILEWLTASSNEIDAYLAARGTSVPITNASDITVLQQYAILPAAALVLESTYQGPDAAEKAAAWRRSWREFIKSLADNKFILRSESVDSLRTGLLKFADND